jgi:MoaA/NifB/PqqE/SkfB family radical SAM enzyme
MWHVTDRCPLRCPYCFATKTELDTDITKLEQVIATFKALGVQKVDIAGGEPLVWTELPTTVQTLVKHGFSLTLTTSGVGSDANRRWIVDQASLFTRIIISIDGPTDAEHDSLRRFPGAFAAAGELIERLHRSEYTNLRINTVLVKPMNDLGTLKRFAAAISVLRPQEWCIIQPHPANQKPSFTGFAVESPAFLDAIEKLTAIAKSEQFTVGRIISRDTEQYAGYWVLYPDGVLRRHTAGPEDCAAMPIFETTIELMIATIQQYGYIVPMRSV